MEDVVAVVAVVVHLGVPARAVRRVEVLAQAPAAQEVRVQEAEVLEGKLTFPLFLSLFASSDSTCKAIRMPTHTGIRIKAKQAPRS